MELRLINFNWYVMLCYFDRQYYGGPEGTSHIANMCAHVCNVVKQFANMCAHVCNVVKQFANMCAHVCNVVKQFANMCAHVCEYYLCTKQYTPIMSAIPQKG